MNANQNPNVSAPKRRSRYLPPGHRVLHVQVPEDIFNGAKARALVLKVDWPEYVIELLREIALTSDDLPANPKDSAPATT